ncbi:MAG: permease-like cell division protein FtsX [Coriobacteriales bacterium]|nr:permease-like cell division protein FtsX [Coriobacteriales bacterium]
MSKIIYFIKEAVSSSRHNLGTTVGGIITIFLSLLMVGLAIIFSAMISSVTSSFEEEVNISAYVADEATDDQINEFNEYLDSQKNPEGNISSYQFLTKEQALEKFSNSMSKSSEIVDQLDGNPLPRTYIIEMYDTQKVEQTANNILENEAFLKICDSKDKPTESVSYGQDTVKRLFTTINIIRYACIFVIILLIFISLVFLNNTIRLAILARRKEISIMRLVGASNGFIRGPFIMEGALQALVAAILAIIVLAILSATVIPGISNMVSFMNMTVEPGVYTMTYLILVVAGIIVGALGSIIAMRRYLKV